MAGNSVAIAADVLTILQGGSYSIATDIAIGYAPAMTREDDPGTAVIRVAPVGPVEVIRDRRRPSSQVTTQVRVTVARVVDPDDAAQMNSTVLLYDQLIDRVMLNSLPNETDSIQSVEPELYDVDRLREERIFSAEFVITYLGLGGL